MEKDEFVGLVRQLSLFYKFAQENIESWGRWKIMHWVSNWYIDIKALLSFVRWVRVYMHANHIRSHTLYFTLSPA